MSWTAIATAVAVATVPYNASDEAAARAWIAQAGHRFDPAATGSADLAPLVERLAGARVIGIGEATHGTHQDEAFKAELIKALVRAGAIDTVAIECNRAAGYGFDRYVRFGEGDPAALMRSPSFFSIWRNDAFGGLLLWLRAWNQKADKPIRVVGIDNQSTGVDASVALVFLMRHDPESARRLRDAMGALLPTSDGTPVFLFDWVAKSDRATFDAMFKAATELETRLVDADPKWRDDPDYNEARYAAKVARQGLFEFDHEFKGADKKFDEPEYYSRRDGFMASNLIERIGGGRAALWAHDSHVASAFLAADEKAGWRNLGWSIRGKLGAGYQTVGFSWSRATLNVVSLPDAARNPPVETRVYSDVPLRNDRPGELGHLFSALPGDGWWVDMRARPRSPALDRWAARPTWRGWAGWRVDPANWQKKDEGSTRAPGLGFDVIVWFRNMSPARVWPGR
jgi:erythromycin esterase